ncbi:endodeoxyribonuclease [Tritrichomonas musculus]|uniref:DNA topoisomerase (ATP-hydrolyzing) n=1 Tax=Tritrichomonas musculus TaxID=1915356 RepID=A0ABR2ICX0_9EUKA
MINEDTFSQWLISGDDTVSYAKSNIISPDSVIEKIKNITEYVLSQLQDDTPPDDIEIQLNERNSELNSQVDPILGVFVQYDTPLKKTYSLVKNPHRFAVFFRVLSIAYRNLIHKEILTKRSIFYHDCDLFDSQNVVDDVIEDISCCLEIPRASLNIIACQKGLVAGPLQWIITSNDNNNQKGSNNILIDCSNKVEQIPSMIDTICAQKTKAIAILVVEKEAVFQRLVQSSIVHEIIIVTARGMPDYSTRLFLKLLEDSFDIPIVGLFDADPYGIFIFFVYRFGSRSSAYDGMNMSIPSMLWLGIRPSELNELSLPKKAFKEQDENDHKLLDKLLKEKNIPECYKAEINILKDLNVKCEIEALTNDLNRLVDIYLPLKFRKHDWI